MTLDELTGRADGPPLPPPAALATGLRRLAAELAARGLPVDPLRACCERAELSGFSRHGDVSCGGATRLLRASDGWVAVCLARADDIASVPAWLGLTQQPEDVWATVTALVRERACADAVANARLLGIPASGLGEVSDGDPVTATTFGARVRRRAAPLVVDLSALWAGPLCSRVLQLTGARVVKVESRDRPDGARSGPPAFFDALNSGKEHRIVDFAVRHDVACLRALLASADVVIEASRPRALEQLGISAAELVEQGPSVWVSITGYGRADPGRDWVAFGDDAAVAGGLVVWDERGPCFCADAIADPLTGLTAAVAALDALEREDAVLLDVAMARVAARYAGTR